MEPQSQVESLVISNPQAVTIGGYVEIAVGINKRANVAPNFNPTEENYKGVCEDDDYKLLVDQDFYKKFTVLYNIQVKETDGNSYYFGFIAQDNASKEYVITFRGTQNGPEKDADNNANPVDFTYGQVPGGFNSIFEGGQVVSLPGKGTFSVPLKDFATNMREHLDIQQRITVTGYSLGAAVSTYFCAYATATFDQRKDLNLRFCTFASPRTGNDHFVKYFSGLIKDSARIHNIADAVPDFPFYDNGDGSNYYKQVTVPEIKVNSTGNKHVKTGPECAHQLSVYLYLLDGSKNPNIVGSGGHMNCQPVL